MRRQGGRFETETPPTSRAARLRLRLPAPGATREEMRMYLDLLFARRSSDRWP